MNRSEAERLLALADRLWMVGEIRGREKRLADALARAEEEGLLDEQRLSLLAAPEPERLQAVASAGAAMALQASPPVRMGNPDTSRRAAESITELRARQIAVLELLRRHPGGLTDDEIQAIYERDRIVPKQAPSGLRTRRDELVKAGLVCNSGLTRRKSTGRQAIVWKIVRGGGYGGSTAA